MKIVYKVSKDHECKAKPHQLTFSTEIVGTITNIEVVSQWNPKVLQRDQPIKNWSVLHS